MAEMQISKIIVVREGSQFGATDEAYREVTAKIAVNSNNPPHIQQIAVVHEVLGTYLGVSVANETLTEIAEAIIDAISELE